MPGFSPEIPLRRQGLIQFIKFCTIGATSALIDISLFTLLQTYMNPSLAKGFSFAIAVVNGFTWNSLWTFRGMGSGRRHEQFVKFLLINIVGLGLQLIVLNSVFLAFAHRFPIKNDPLKFYLYSGLFVGIVVGSVWNFLANKKWTYGGEVSVPQ